MNLKIEHKKDLKQYKVDDIEAVKQAGPRNVKVTTNQLVCKYDSKDSRYINAIKNLKLIYKLDEGCLILKGSLACTYTDGFRGNFYVVDVIKDPSANFDSIKGVETEINFSNPINAISNNDLMEVLKSWANHPDLVYNIEQFDEFMNLFEFYKKLSAELSNNRSFDISKMSKPYFFIALDDADIELQNQEEIINQNGIIVGYKLRQEQYDQLSNAFKDNVKQLVDIEITGGDVYKRIRSIGLECIYISDFKNITEREIPSLVQVQVVSTKQEDGKLVISGELKNPNASYNYLNLYDMGQKIKVESIDNSLKLINQGASGAASELLRYLIGDDDMPNNPPQSSDEVKERYMHGLNDSQRKAFLMAIDGSPVSLIKGPPGTGKTHVINAIVQYITKELKEKVVISSQTHIAIDNVLDKLMSDFDPVIPNRITNRRNKYSDAEIDATLYKTWGTNFKRHNERASNKELASKVLASLANFKGTKEISYSKGIGTGRPDYSVIGATTTTSAISGTKGLEVLKGFNWLIIDEVSKCPITEVLRYLPYVEKIIMVGDDFQLAPLLEFNKKDVQDLESYDEEKFDRLRAMYENSVFAKTLRKAEKCDRIVLLNENYRSVKNVLQLYNVFYDNKLIGRRESSQPSTVRLNSQVLNEDKDIFFVEVLHGKELRDDNDSRYNVEEIKATEEILKELMSTAINPGNISVAAIFPYGAQISRFQKSNSRLINDAKKLFKSFDIDTVDAFQGKEADIVLCNTVVADISRANKSFLTDFRRINVSMSRAKDKLIIFGNSTVLSKIEMSISGLPKRTFFNDIIQFIEYNGKKIIYDGGLKNENRSKSSITFA